MFPRTFWAKLGSWKGVGEVRHRALRHQWSVYREDQCLRFLCPGFLYLSPVSCILLRDHRVPSCTFLHGPRNWKTAVFYGKNGGLGDNKTTNKPTFAHHISIQVPAYPNGPPEAPQWIPKGTKWSPKCTPMDPQRHPKARQGSPMNSKGAQNGPNRCPTNSQGEQTMHRGTQQHHVFL